MRNSGEFSPEYLETAQSLSNTYGLEGARKIVLTWWKIELEGRLKNLKAPPKSITFLDTEIKTLA